MPDSAYSSVSAGNSAAKRIAYSMPPLLLDNKRCIYNSAGCYRLTARSIKSIETGIRYNTIYADNLIAGVNSTAHKEKPPGTVIPHGVGPSTFHGDAKGKTGRQ